MEKGRRCSRLVTTLVLVGIAGCGAPGRRDRTVDLLLELPGAAISVPEGATASDYVHVQLVTARGDGRTAIFVHPPASVSFRIRPAAGARLQSAIGIDDGAVARGSDGARFVVEVRDPPEGAPELLFEHRIAPDGAAGAAWVPLDVDLGAYAGRDVTLTLRTEPGEAPENDWVGFATPQILSVGRAARRPGGGDTIVLASLDTLRVDVLGAFGDPRMLSPHVDRFTRRGELHPDAVTPSHWTLPAHASLVTSTYPDVNLVRPGRRIPASVPTLAERLAAAGYAAAGFVTDVHWLDGAYGFDRGFAPYLATVEASASRTRRARAWLEGAGSSDAFLFLHYFDPHSDFGAVPYEASASSLAAFAADAGSQPRCESYRCASAELQRMNDAGARYARTEEAGMRAAYAAGVADTDVEVGRLVAELRGAGRYEGATVVLVSDHGEEFAEHGRYLHTQVYPELTRALLCIRRPGGAPGRIVGGLASLVDVAPTILAQAGAAAPETFQGVDLAGIRPRTAYGVGQEGQVVLRDAERTVIRWPDGELTGYRRDLDPAELSPEPEDGSSALAQELLARRQAHDLIARVHEAGGSVDLTAAERERLEALGYTVGGAGKP